MLFDGPRVLENLEGGVRVVGAAGNVEDVGVARALAARGAFQGGRVLVEEGREVVLEVDRELHFVFVQLADLGLAHLQHLRSYFLQKPLRPLTRATGTRNWKFPKRKSN